MCTILIFEFFLDDATLSDDDSSDYSDWNIDENSDYEYETYLEDQPNEFETKKRGVIESFSNSTEKAKVSEMKYSKVLWNMINIATNCLFFQYSEVQIQTAISHIKDLLPHLGEGFIMASFQCYLYLYLFFHN